MKKIYFILVLFNLISFNIYSQGANCASADPFCAGGSALTFPNSTATTSEPGINYECLGSQPNPAWFYMQIGVSGPINFQLSQTSNGGTPIDVDYIIWGPFSTPVCGPANLNPASSVSCSFSPAAIENFTIPAAVVGQIYVVLITNFSGTAGNITVTQTNAGVPGAGATNCDIVCPLTITGGGTFCPGTPATLTTTISALSTPAIYAGATFAWTSTAAGFVPPATNVGSITVTAPGTYTVTVNKPGCVANGTASSTYTVATPPVLGVPTNPLTICNPSTTYNLNLNTPLIQNGNASLIVDYHTTQISALDGSIGANLIPNPGSYTGTSGQTIWVSIENAASCIFTTSFTLGTINCCDSITASTGNQTLCVGADPTPFSATTTATGPNSIAFVYFTTPQTGSNMYTGGTPLLTASPVLGIATFNPPVLGAPTSLPNVPGTYYVYAILNPTPTNPICRAFQEIIVTVNNQPDAGNNGTVTICDSNTTPIDLNTLITGQQTGGTWTQSTGTGGSFNTATGVFSPAAGATTSTFTYTLSGTAPCVTDTSTATVTINPQPNAGANGSLSLCNSGVTIVNLNTIITGQQLGGTWTRTSGTGGVFVSTGTFTTAIGATNSTFTYTLNGNLPCINDFSIATVNFATPPTITAPTPYQVCDDNNDGLSCLFFLHTKDIEIAAPGLTVEYYETLTNAQLGAAVNIITQNPYCNLNNTGLQTLYVRVYDPAAPSCYSITTLDLIVNPRPLPNPVITDYVFCDVTSSGDGFEVFDLGTKDLEIANGLSLANYTIDYYLTQGDAIAQTSPLPNIYQNVTPNLQQIWINIRNNATGCNSVASFNLVVNSLPLVVAPPPMFQCSNGAIMTAAFDLTLNDAQISGGIFGVSVTYYLTLADAQNEVSPLPIPYTNAIPSSQVIYVRVENIATGCFDTTSLTLNVTQGPIANIPPPLQYCDPNNDGIGVFDLNTATSSIVGGVLPPGVSISYHETPTDAQIAANALVSPYTNITDWSQIIYVRVFYTLTGCANYVQLKLNVNPTPEATQPQDYHVCDDNFDGFAVFDLSVINSEVLGSISAATHLVTYHTSLPDAQAGVGAITNILNYTNTIITTQTLWIRVETTATGCYDIVTLQLVVDPLPQSTQPAYAPYSLCDTTAPLGFEQFDLQSQEATILLGQLGMSVTFYPSLAQAQAQIGAIPSGLYTNIAPFVQTLGVVITNTASGCYVISTMDIRVEPLPTPIPPLQAYAVCDNDQDGFSQFDLCTLTAAINVGGYIITYHETQPDAQSNNNALACIYNNILSFTQIIWVRAEDTITHCVSTMPIVLQVDASPIMPTPLPTLTLCDTDSNNQNGITSFDLSQQTAALLAAQTNAAINYSVTYYNSQIAAQSGVGNIVSTTTYQGFDSQVIWVRIEHNATGCFIVGSFTLEVNIPLLLTTPTPLSVCDNDANPNDLHTTFDLTVKDNQITTGLPGYTVMYYPTYANALAGVNLITNPTAYINVPPAVQTIGVAVTSADGCKSYITLDIRVLPVPTPNTNPTVLVAQCENALNSGVQTMDITVNAAYIINSDPNVTLHYYHSLADATSIPPMNEILTPTAALIGDPSLLNVTPRPLNLVQNVYVVVSSNLFVDFNAQNCYTVVQQPFIINPLPLVVAIGAQQLCEADPTGNDGFEIFDLTDYNADLLAGNVTLPASNYTVTFYTDAALTNQIATPTAYTNTTNPQTIYAQVTNTSTGCSNSNSFDIIVNPKPLLTPPLDFSSCDSELNDNDGFYLYPLDVLVSGILNGQSPGNFTVSFYHTQADADATPPTNAISDLANYQAQSETIWIRVENNTTGCYQIGSFDIIIEQYASPVIETVNNINTICVNFITSEVERSLTLFASNETVYLADPQPSYDYQWFIDGVAIPGAVSPGYTIDTALPNNESAVYTVSMTTTGALGCSTTSQSFTVYQSGPAVVAAGTIGYTVTDAFTENQIITVSVEGWGDYQYSLDDGPRQDSPVFENVSLGSHLITVWDTQGGLDFSCDALVIELIQTIDYPHYFTPNGDGIHDTWNIVGLEGQPSTKIYIFDRFGKLIKQISSTGQGWDGTYNGQQLPSTDYWFTVDYNEQESQKQFRAHFSLKR